MYVEKYFEMRYYRNKGSLHLNSLCKWGPSVLKLRKRVFPSGKPIEKKFIIKKKIQLGN